MEIKSFQVSTMLHILFAQPLFLFTKTSKSALGFYTLGMGPNLRCFFQSNAMMQVFFAPHVGSSRDPLLQAKTFCEDYNLQFVEAHVCFSKHGNWDLELANNSNAKLLFSYKTSNCWLLSMCWDGFSVVIPAELSKKFPVSQVVTTFCVFRYNQTNNPPVWLTAGAEEVMGPLLDQMGSFLDQESKGEPGASWASRISPRDERFCGDSFRLPPPDL